MAGPLVSNFIQEYGDRLAARERSVVTTSSHLIQIFWNQTKWVRIPIVAVYEPNSRVAGRKRPQCRGISARHWVFLDEAGGEIARDAIFHNGYVIALEIVVEWQLNVTVIKQDQISGADASGDVLRHRTPGFVFRLLPIV